jgi:serine/threonine protein kinase
MATAYGPIDIPGYRLERLLGSGGFADVYLYSQELLGRSVAVKIMRDEVEAGAPQSQFLGEANLMAQLATHPSIVTIFSADVSATGRPYIMMEYCSRPSLAERYKARPLSVAEMLQTMIRLCGAVETAHRAGILHRDIKPANVLTTDYGWPALTDFGISAIVGEGTVGGGGMSVPWSPPEAFTGATPLDARSDVYSLAATAYTVLAGRSPFDEAAQSPDMGAFVYRILEAPVPPIDRADLPETLQRLLAVAMAKNPDDRPPSAASLARALQRIEHDLMLPATPLDVPDALVDDLERTQTHVRSAATDATVQYGSPPVPSPAAPLAAVTRPASPPPPPLPPDVASAPPLDPELDATVVVTPALADDADDRTVVVDDRTVVVDDRTVVLDDRTVVVDDRTLVLDRSDATAIIARPRDDRVTHRDVPLPAGRVAYVPDPDEVSRYRARRTTEPASVTRVTLEPPPQRQAQPTGAPSVSAERRRGLTGLAIGLSLGIVGAIAGVVLLVVIAVGAAG